MWPSYLGQPLDFYCGSIEEAKKAAEENYLGCYKSMADYAEELSDSTGDIPPHLEYYIDYERMGKDMELNGDIYTIETRFDEIHIFSNY